MCSATAGQLCTSAGWLCGMREEWITVVSPLGKPGALLFLVFLFCFDLGLVYIPPLPFSQFC